MKDIKARTYPFVNRLVDALYTDDINSTIENSIEGHYDKNILMMFVVLYFGLYLSIDHPDSSNKEYIKEALSDIIRDHDKRTACLQFFCTLGIFEKNENLCLEAPRNLKLKDKKTEDE
jgi:hypothetical protein